ncbi:hypothetical protein FOZ62_001811 [Perkinsus olseni]|uniref:Uncharacterized protein n=1 Tax=Perkinsus olseni TaxID=32597 RepID=A0A7J6NIL6_PEROL|nr:hypothetical protein FOZ62_001811 [Perkinsus olseni]
MLEAWLLVPSMEEVNFRVAGRLHGGRLCLGSVHDPYDSDTGKGPRSSIPARLQTVLSRGLREPIGFGRESSRFELPRVADGPGPGACVSFCGPRREGVVVGILMPLREDLSGTIGSLRIAGLREEQVPSRPSLQGFKDGHTQLSYQVRLIRIFYLGTLLETPMRLGDHARPAFAGYRASSTTLAGPSQKRFQCRARTDWSGFTTHLQHLISGPGTYRVSVSADQAASSGSTATLSCCGRSDLKLEPKPGPGQYDPLYPNLPRIRTALLSMSDSRLPKLEPQSAPGPGAYDPAIVGRVAAEPTMVKLVPSTGSSSSQSKYELGLTRMANSDSVSISEGTSIATLGGQV